MLIEGFCFRGNKQKKVRPVFCVVKVVKFLCTIFVKSYCFANTAQTMFNTVTRLSHFYNLNTSVLLISRFHSFFSYSISGRPKGTKLKKKKCGAVCERVAMIPGQSCTGHVTYNQLKGLWEGNTHRTQHPIIWCHNLRLMLLTTSQPRPQ